MKLLYINYWSLGNPLTKATVFPNLEMLKPYFSEITLATIERESPDNVEVPAAIRHRPFKSAAHLPYFLCKLHDLIFYFLMLFFLSKREKPHLIICRGSMAGIFGFFVGRLLKIPFIVESFEPHAEYMAEGGTWQRSSLSFRFQSWGEKMIIKHAACLIPVSNNYKNYLITVGVETERVCVMPCCVDLAKFSFKADDRKKMRQKFGIEESVIVGVYVGKFGDLYLDEEAFGIFRETKKYFGENFYLIILTPQDKISIEKQLEQAGFSKQSIFVDRVDHSEVPYFLSASDFAFSLVRSSSISQFCCPVKNGEYWANGLPIVLPMNVGDDEMIIREMGCGAVFNVSNLSTLVVALSRISEMSKMGRQKLADQIERVAHRYRNFSIIEGEYKKLLTKFGFIEYKD